MIHAQWHEERVANAVAYFTQKRPDPMAGFGTEYAPTHGLQFVRYSEDDLVFVFTPTYQRFVINRVNQYPSDSDTCPTLTLRQSDGAWIYQGAGTFVRVFLGDSWQHSGIVTVHSITVHISYSQLDGSLEDVIRRLDPLHYLLRNAHISLWEA